MSYTRIVKGTYTKIVHGNYNMYANGNINFTAGKEINIKSDVGINYGSEMKDPPVMEMEMIMNCLINFLPCSNYMELSKPERKGEIEPDTSKIYGFDCMLKYYEDNYGYYWNSKDLNEENKAISTKVDNISFSDLEKEYNPLIITWKKNRNKYYVPWLSIYNGQTIRLQIEMDWNKQPKKIEWDSKSNYKDKFNLPDLSNLKIQKSFQEIEITCIKEFSDNIQLKILADGVLAGKLNIIPNKKRKLKITWCLVDISGKNKKGEYIDIKALKDKLSQQKINRFVKYLGLSQALIETEATDTYKELHLSDMGYSWDKYTKIEGYKYSGNSILKERRYKLQLDCKKEYEKLYPKDDNQIVMFLINKPASQTITNHVEKTIEENLMYRIKGSAFNLGSKYLILYEKFEEYPKIIVHEILHCLKLHHSFDEDSKHKFKAYSTENFMDYVYGEENDNRKILWKWQWDIIRNYIDNGK